MLGLHAHWMGKLSKFTSWVTCWKGTYFFLAPQIWSCRSIERFKHLGSQSTAQISFRWKICRDGLELWDWWKTIHKVIFSCGWDLSWTQLFCENNFSSYIICGIEICSVWKETVQKNQTRFWSVDKKIKLIQNPV